MLNKLSKNFIFKSKAYTIKKTFFILAKRLTKDQKKEIKDSFSQGESIDDLSKIHQCTKTTIIRNLKKDFGDKHFKELFNISKLKNKSSESKLVDNINDKKSTGGLIPFNKETKENDSSNNDFSDDIISQNQFLEIAPLDYEIDNLQQKDLASVPISDADFPKIAYMIVDKKIELTTKQLKEYPEWQFLSQDELNRKTIEIYFELKVAKRYCNKEQKVIKVPNTNVFKLVAPILLKRGISRIVSVDKLIAL